MVAIIGERSYSVWAEREFANRPISKSAQVLVPSLPDRKSKITFSLRTDKAGYKLGEEPIIYACLANESKIEYTIEGSRSCKDHPLKSIDISVLDEKGRKAGVYTEVLPEQRLNFGAPIYLRPGKNDCLAIPISNYVKLDSPGNYTVNVFFRSGTFKAEKAIPISLSIPTSEDARLIVDTVRDNQDAGDTNCALTTRNMKLKTYLPYLLSAVKAGNHNAIDGLANHITPETIDLLVDVVTTSNDKLSIMKAWYAVSKMASKPIPDPGYTFTANQEDKLVAFAANALTTGDREMAHAGDWIISRIAVPRHWRTLVAVIDRELSTNVAIYEQLPIPTREEDKGLFGLASLELLTARALTVSDHKDFLLLNGKAVVPPRNDPIRLTYEPEQAEALEEIAKSDTPARFLILRRLGQILTYGREGQDVSIESRKKSFILPELQAERWMTHPHPYIRARAIESSKDVRAFETLFSDRHPLVQYAICRQARKMQSVPTQLLLTYLEEASDECSKSCPSEIFRCAVDALYRRQETKLMNTALLSKLRTGDDKTRNQAASYLCGWKFRKKNDGDWFGELPSRYSNCVKELLLNSSGEKYASMEAEITPEEAQKLYFYYDNDLTVLGN